MTRAPFVLDDASLLLDTAANATIQDIESFLRLQHRVLRGAPGEVWRTRTVAEWLASGAPPAAPLARDPVDHLVAGFSATDLLGARAEVPPSPRRSAGPDLTCLFFGCDPPLLRLERVWLRVEHESSGVAGASFSDDPDETDIERALFDRVRDEMLHAK